MSALFRNPFTRAPEPSGPHVPRGYRVYAVGDVHGRLDLLEDILSRIESDNRSRGPAKTVILFLGDLIDRGPSSSQVVERLRTYRPADVRLVFLMGNHEEVLVRLLRGESGLVRDWLRFGGAECARSYGISSKALKAMEPMAAVTFLSETIPAVHQRFLEGFADTFRIGSYLFVHAGIRPGVPLSEQRQTDLRWIREPFLQAEDDHGFVVVHGHTISAEVDQRANRIGLDTGAYRSGRLTALALEGAERWILQTGSPSVGGEDSRPVMPTVASAVPA